MKSQGSRLFRWFIVIDILLNALVLIGAANMIYSTYQYLSFGGFMALFELLLLGPFFFATAFVQFLLILYIKENHSPKMVLAAFVLQLAAPILWVLFAYAMETVGWLESIMTVQSIVGILGILLWLVKGRKNQS